MAFGKTTVAKCIEKDFDYKYVKDPLKELLEIDEEHLKRISDKIFNLYDDKIKAWYLALGDVYALENNKNKNIVMDRHILLNYFWNGNKNTESIFNTQIELFGRPDITIVLYASPETRMKRIAKRNPNDSDLDNDNMKVFGYDKLIGFLDKYNYNYVMVNTEELSIQEVVSKCEVILKSLEKILQLT